VNLKEAPVSDPLTVRAMTDAEAHVLHDLA
jgi:hypothetical protein